MKQSWLSFSWVLFFITIALVEQSSAQSPTSVYTKLVGKGCKTLTTDKETGSITQVCPGVGGYRLKVDHDDDRATITIIDPAGKEHALNYWQVVTTAFSSLGEKAEWRVIKKKGKTTPIALIVRVNASEDPENSRKITSYLSVAKMTAQQACVITKIKPGATQNQEARRAADAAANQPCLER